MIVKYSLIVLIISTYILLFSGIHLTTKLNTVVSDYINTMKKTFYFKIQAFDKIKFISKEREAVN